jgi:L-threonylcarbamoyladenylate synthase
MKITPFSDYQTPAGKQEIIECLKKGGVVVFPSDTVYGLLCDASNPEAVSKLLAFKDRPPGKAISIFVTDISMMDEYCEVPPEKRDMLLTMLPGSYTVVLDSKHKLDTRLESETGTLGTRWIAFEPVRELMYTYGKPVTATSANLGGHSPHYSAKSFLNDLPKKKEEYIDIVVDAGELPHNKPSTVIDFTTQELKILRLGDKVAKNTVFHSSLSADPIASEALAELESSEAAVQPFFVKYFTVGTPTSPPLPSIIICLLLSFSTPDNMYSIAAATGGVYLNLPDSHQIFKGFRQSTSSSGGIIARIFPRSR